MKKTNKTDYIPRIKINEEILPEELEKFRESATASNYFLYTKNSTPEPKSTLTDDEVYLQKIRCEQEEILDKILKLNAFLYTDKYYSLSNIQQILLTHQLAAMDLYELCLDNRIDDIEFTIEENKKGDETNRQSNTGSGN